MTTKPDAARATAPQLPPFPTMLRKMWSGREVQQWIDENIKPVAQPSDDYKAMFEDAVRDLAAITAALDIHPDQSGGAGPVLKAIEALKKGGGGEAAMQRACGELPDGFKLHVCLEAGAGWVELFGPDNERIEFDEDTNDGMTGRIHAAIDLVVKADKEFEDLNRE